MIAVLRLRWGLWGFLVLRGLLLVWRFLRVLRLRSLLLLSFSLLPWTLLPLLLCLSLQLPLLLSSPVLFLASLLPFPDSSAPPPDPSASFTFDHSNDLPEDSPPDAVPRVLDPGASVAFPDSVHSEFRRMMSFILDLFPQAAGSPSVPPPPHALFEDFFFSHFPKLV